MAISHVKSDTVADFTGTITGFNSVGGTETIAATALVRPSDWNSAHNMYMTLSGNTAGASTLSGTNIVLAGGSNITLSANGSTVSIIGTSGGGGGGGNVVAAGTQTAATSGTVKFSNSNGITFGMSNSSIVTASHNALTGLTLTAPNGSFTFSNLRFLDINGLSFVTTAGAPDGAVKASMDWAGNAFALSNTTQSSSGPLTITALSVRGHGILSAGISNGSIVLSATQSDQAFSAQGGSSAFQTLSFSNANGFTFSNNAGQVVGSYTVPTVTNSSMTISDAATSGTLARLAFTNLNGITLSLSSGAGGSHTIVGSYQRLSVSNAIASVGSATNSGTNTTRFAADDHIHAGVFSMGVSTAGNTAGNTRVDVGRFVLQGSGNITMSQITAANALNTINISVAAAAGDGGNILAAGTRTAGSNSSVLFSNSNNITFGLDAVAGSIMTASFDPINIGMSNLGNTAGTSGTVDGAGAQFVFAGVTPISLSQSVNGSSATLSVYAPVISTFEPMPLAGLSTNSVAAGNATSSPVSVWPFVVNHPLTGGIMDLMFSAAFLTVGTSSGRQTMGIHAGLYQRGAGANSTRLESVVTQSVGFSITGNNSSYSINQITTTNYTGYGATAQTASAGSSISSGYTGIKKIGIPINSYLSPGQYWLGLMGTNSTSSVNVGLSLSYFGAVVATQATAMAPMGSFSSAYSTGSNPVGGRWADGLGVWSSAGSVTALPASINFASITASANSVQPHMRFWST
jgi:hypothetical protein